MRGHVPDPPARAERWPVPVRRVERAPGAVGHSRGGLSGDVGAGRIVQRIGPNGIRLTQLADQAQVTKQTAGALVDQLVASGYLEPRPDPTDARARLICMSELGARVWAVATAELDRVQGEWARHVGADRWAELHRTLNRLREIADPYV